MAAIRFGPEDRDDRGFVRAPEPRSLADLMPRPEDIQADAQRTPTRAPKAAEWIGVLCVAALGLALLWYFGGDPRVAPPRTVATVPATTAPAAPTTPAAPTPLSSGTRALIAFAAPEGAVLGAIESTRAITPTAHYGSDWIQADVAGSGLVWLRTSDAPELAIVGPDLAPRPVVPQPAYVPAAAPAVPPAPFVPAPVPTDPPPPCAEAGTPGKMVQVCDYADLETLQAQAKAQWIATYGGNEGIVKAREP